MKNLIKKYNKVVLFAGVLLFSFEVFSASEATKRMIHDTLSKFCIPPKKENCNPREEGQYDPNYNFCLCEDDGMVYSKSQRKCVECGKGTYYRRNMKDNSCKSCSPGTYQDEIGKSSCKFCYPGSYSSGYGNSDCSPCSPGTFQDEVGKYSCKNCDTNACKTSDTGATGCYFACRGSRPYCDGSGSCVECTSDSHCNYYCVSNSCVRCRYDSDCGTNYSCSSGSCVCDITDSDCECGARSSGCGCKRCPPPPPPKPKKPTDPCGGCPEGQRCIGTVECVYLCGNKTDCNDGCFSCQ